MCSLSVVVPRFGALIVLAVALGAAALARVQGENVARAAAGEADRFRIVSCSLGCSSPGNQVTCSTVNVHVNPELRIDFSQAIDWTSLGAPAFQVFAVGTGSSPSASLLLDPKDAQTLIWRPQVTFDIQGNPIFGLSQGSSYQLIIPGALVDPLGPYITSVHGLPVENRMQCTLSATLGIRDYVPGPPLATITVDVVIPSDPGTTLLEPAAAEGARNVSLATDIELAFDDVMYLGTLITPATGSSSSVVIGRAPDPVADPIAGQFSFSIDLDENTTTLTFTPDQALPPGEKILVRLDATITDLAGNALRNAGTIAFATLEP